jgi:hypothetical protein
MNFSLNLPVRTDNTAETAPGLSDEAVVLAREAGVPFRPTLDADSGIDPFAEWLTLMEVVQMLCPVWPVRDKPMQGDHWRL